MPAGGGGAVIALGTWGTPRGDGRPRRGRLDRRSGRTLGDSRPERIREDDAVDTGRGSPVAIVRDRRDSGTRLGRVDVRTLRPRIALVSGSVTRQLRADLPARDVVVSGRYGALETWWHRYSDEDWAEADRLLEESGFAVIGSRPFGVISEGERQHVLLARALMSRPELLLLDEPAAGLDLGARERLVSRLGVLAADPNSPPMVLVTHHCEEIPAASRTPAWSARAG